MGFAVLANQLRRFSAQMQRRAKQVFQLFAAAISLLAQLSLDQTPQQAAAGLSGGARLGIEPRQQIVGD